MGNRGGRCVTTALGMFAQLFKHGLNGDLWNSSHRNFSVQFNYKRRFIGLAYWNVQFHLGLYADDSFTRKHFDCFLSLL